MYFTPPELASYVARSADLLARDAFGRGLGDCQIVDPALGDGVFARATLAIAPAARILAYEILPEVARLAAASLPGTVVVVAGSALDGFPPLAPGAIPVILGNPPWRGHTANPGTIADLLADYYRFGDRPERNTKWLQDDYIRFFRWAQEVVDRAGRGIVGFVTNHAWLRGPTHRAMRTSLRATFDEIRVLDLHGSYLRRETPPDGGPDENVFPVRPGCAVVLLLKNGAVPVELEGRRHTNGSGGPLRGGNDFGALAGRSLSLANRALTLARSSPCVGHFDLWGRKAEKLAWLAAHDAATTRWTWLPAGSAPAALVPGLSDPQYDSWPSLTDLFGVWSVGMVSGRDAQAYFPTREALLAAHPELALEEAFGALYRPGDVRWTAFRLHTRPRRRVMEPLLMPGAKALVALRQAGPAVTRRFLVTDRPVDNCVLSTESTARAYAFPLRLADGTSNMDGSPLGISDPEAAFDHVVQLLADLEYQERYRASLLGAFPRIRPRER